MHPLMPPILLGLSRPNPFGPNTQFDPPHGELGQTPKPQAGKGPAVVAANDLRQPMFPESPFKTLPHTLQLLMLHGLYPQEIPAPAIGQRPRLTPLPVAQDKPALEISAPHPVSMGVGFQRFPSRRTPPPVYSRLNQSFAP